MNNKNNLMSSLFCKVGMEDKAKFSRAALALDMQPSELLQKCIERFNEKGSPVGLNDGQSVPRIEFTDLENEYNLLKGECQALRLENDRLKDRSDPGPKEQKVDLKALRIKLGREMKAFMTT